VEKEKRRVQLVQSMYLEPTLTALVVWNGPPGSSLVLVSIRAVILVLKVPVKNRADPGVEKQFPGSLVNRFMVVI